MKGGRGSVLPQMHAPGLLLHPKVPVLLLSFAGVDSGPVLASLPQAPGAAQNHVRGRPQHQEGLPHRGG